MGAPLIELRNEFIVVRVDEAFGAMIDHVGRSDDENVLFVDAPPDSSRPTTYLPDDDSEAAWMSTYRGGWQELFPNAGTACTVDNIPHRYHGEGSTDAWTVVAHGVRHR